MQRPTHVYSSILSCLYDEQQSVGYFGHGAHYSILRCVEPLNVDRNIAPIPQLHDFAVIWDEDHDTRVIALIEQLYMSNLFSPVQFIGERKGTIYIIVAARWHMSSNQKHFEDWQTKVEQVVTNGFYQDSWFLEIGFFDRAELRHQTEIPAIIPAKAYKVEDYLRTIDHLWQLGTRPFGEGDSSLPSLKSLPPVPQGGYSDAVPGNVLLAKPPRLAPKPSLFHGSKASQDSGSLPWQPPAPIAPSPKPRVFAPGMRRTGPAGENADE